MTDAEQLMKPLLYDVAAAAFAFAPERADTLVNEVMGGPWDILYEGGAAQMEALPKSKAVRATFACLLSLWAVAASAFRIGNAGMAATRNGCGQLDLTPGSPVATALDLKEQALQLIRDPAAVWQSGLPRPQASPGAGSDEEYVNNLFLGACGFIVLHEIAHIHLAHQVCTPLMHEQENEADEWAAHWAIDQAPSALHREFRTLATAVALCWIGLVDEVRRADSTHPHASERMGKVLLSFGLVDESPALEIAAYVTKAFFDPHAPIPAADHATEAFSGVLFGYARLPR